MKRILIAIDYNPSAKKVAETGYALAKAMQAEITIVHVFTEPAYYAMEFSPITGYQGGYSAGTATLVEDIKQEAENFLAASAKQFGDSSIKTMLLEGEITDAILKYGKDWNADLIVMGSHRHTGLDRLLASDEAVHMVKHSKIPLMIIPTEE